MVAFTSVFAGLTLVAGSLAAPTEEGMFSKISKRAGTPNSSGMNDGFYYSWVCVSFKVFAWRHKLTPVTVV